MNRPEDTTDATKPNEITSNNNNSTTNNMPKITIKTKEVGFELERLKLENSQFKGGFKD